MVAITIGVPVYNGADRLDECLACLARQTFTDFKVIVLDNASTDATAEIARAWAARDPRFTYARQPHNIGMMPNFSDVVRRADSPWFMWRAHDELTADNYLEALHRLATGSPGCKLAISTCVLTELDGARRSVPPPDARAFVTLRGQLAMLLTYPESWAYSLWDTETARKCCLSACANYPYATACEHLILYGPIAEGAARGTEETEIYKLIRRAGGVAAPKFRYSSAQMLDVRQKFVRHLRRVRSASELSLPVRLAHRAFEPLYVRRRLPSLSKIIRTRVREMLGAWKASAPSPHL
jgi:glycosyltransferase involved in cell wall biosynthesis